MICPVEEHGINRPHGWGGGGGGRCLGLFGTIDSHCEALGIKSLSSSSSPICVHSAVCVKISLVICVCDGYMCVWKEVNQSNQNKTKSELQRVRTERQNDSLNEPLVGRNGMDNDDHRHTMDGGGGGGGIEYCQY